MTGNFPSGLQPVSFSDLPGFESDDHTESWTAFYRSCNAVCRDLPELRRGLVPAPPQRNLCRRALELGRDTSRASIEAFYRSNLVPARILHPERPPRSGAFFTAYYRPEILASFIRTRDFSEPLLARPADLVTFHNGAGEGELSGFSAGRLLPNGAYEPYPDRSQMDDAGGTPQVLAYVADAIEAFMVHVQGSARLKIDGQYFDLTYAGRNGHPYVSIGRILTSTGEISPSEMSLRRLKEWVRRNGQEKGERGRRLLNQNPSFIFFSLSLAQGDAEPLGGAGYKLAPFRSIAIDRSIWPYGMPFWVHADIPWEDETKKSVFSRMMIGQDTGSAIVGASRGDLFFGTGNAAGDLAGGIRDFGEMFVLLPKGAD